MAARPEKCNVMSGYLTDRQNIAVLDALGDNCLVLATAVGELYCSADEKRETRDRHYSGAVCFLKDFDERSFFISFYDRKRREIVWEHDLRPVRRFLLSGEFRRSKSCSSLTIHDCEIIFFREDEADFFQDEIEDVVSRHKEMRARRQRSNNAKNVGSVPSGGKARAVAHRRHRSNKSMDNITKIEKRNPTDFQHVKRVGSDREVALNLKDLYPDARTFIEDIDEETLNLIIDFIDSHGGVDAVSKVIASRKGESETKKGLVKQRRAQDNQSERPPSGKKTAPPQMNQKLTPPPSSNRNASPNSPSSFITKTSSPPPPPPRINQKLLPPPPIIRNQGVPIFRPQSGGSKRGFPPPPPPQINQKLLPPPLPSRNQGESIPLPQSDKTKISRPPPPRRIDQKLLPPPPSQPSKYQDAPIHSPLSGKTNIESPPPSPPPRINHKLMPPPPPSPPSRNQGVPPPTPSFVKTKFGSPSPPPPSQINQQITPPLPPKRHQGVPPPLPSDRAKTPSSQTSQDTSWTAAYQVNLLKQHIVKFLSRNPSPTSSSAKQNIGPQPQQQPPPHINQQITHSPPPIKNESVPPPPPSDETKVPSSQTSKDTNCASAYQDNPLKQQITQLLLRNPTEVTDFIYDIVDKRGVDEDSYTGVGVTGNQIHDTNLNTIQASGSMAFADEVSGRRSDGSVPGAKSDFELSSDVFDDYDEDDDIDDDDEWD